MTRIATPDQQDLPELEPLFEAYKSAMGFVPNTMLSMSRSPGLVDAYVGVAVTCMMNGLISEELGHMVAHITSAAAGCTYCQAHTVAHAAHDGVSEEKLADLWLFATSDHFDDAERAALNLALNAGQHPNAVTDGDIDACRLHNTEDQITAIVAVCSLFGFLNRWNETMATTLEEVPSGVAERVGTMQATGAAAPEGSKQ